MNKNSKYLLMIIFLMMILHQDFWFWDDKSIVFGFLPIGLAYHIGFSLAAGALFAWAVRYCWPEDLEE
jgi:hypothetical protein